MISGSLRRWYVAAGRWIQYPRNRTAVVILLVSCLAAALIGVLSAHHSAPGASALPVTPPRPSAAAPARASTSLSPRRSNPTVSAGRLPRKPFHCSAAAPVRSSRADPVRICIPHIGVDADVMQLGLNADRTVEVPPLSRVGDAGWYRYSATPGAVGPTVILGHVDSAQYGAGVFYRLGRLHAGDTIQVTRADGMIATFVVTDVSEISKRRFPTGAVYGATSGPAIRLVTCGGQFDSATGNYLDNIIAFGTLRTVRKG